VAKQDWNGKKVVIIGAARQGSALARYLAGCGADVWITDRRMASDLQPFIQNLANIPITWALGSHPVSVLDQADLLCLSGGVPINAPLVLEAQKRGIPLSNDSQLFLEAANCKVIGITGSAGKTTTTTLVGRIIEQALSAGKQATGFRKAWVGGNIGNPLISHLGEMQADDLAVMELSSFQLEIMTKSPQVAAILNLTPNHLDRHGNMTAYTEAKARILSAQIVTDSAVLNREDQGAWQLADRVSGRLITFGISEENLNTGTFVGEGMVTYRDLDGEQALVAIGDIHLRGTHNLMNILAASAIIKAVGLPGEAIHDAVRGFLGVPHRLEFVRNWGGADWYNDSIATAPERAIAAIQSFSEPLVLLAGGRDKDLPWEEFATLASQRVRYLILFGEAAGLIKQAMDKVNHGVPVSRTMCLNLEQAVQMAARIVQPGEVVLLSPGGTSFDEFVDFEERGECFRKLVMSL